MRIQIDNHGEIETIEDVAETYVRIVRSNKQERIISFSDVRGVRRIDYDWEDDLASSSE